MKDSKSTDGVSELRRIAARKSHESRWGMAREKSRQIRVDESAFEALLKIPEKSRRKLASEAILSAVAATVPSSSSRA